MRVNAIRGSRVFNKSTVDLISVGSTGSNISVSTSPPGFSSTGGGGGSTSVTHRSQREDGGDLRIAPHTHSASPDFGATCSGPATSTASQAADSDRKSGSQEAGGWLPGAVSEALPGTGKAEELAAGYEGTGAVPIVPTAATVAAAVEVSELAQDPLWEFKQQVLMFKKINCRGRL